ncbi:Relaxase/Mobilisation nuclease domain-containing protein [Rhizobiales bacterium GAS113]|nr:Relaxase/Mobilisation nuclease domain-containing protein [Rhizobiales bacterium GAS113]
MRARPALTMWCHLKASRVADLSERTSAHGLFREVVLAEMQSRYKGDADLFTVFLGDKRSSSDEERKTLARRQRAARMRLAGFNDPYPGQDGAHSGAGRESSTSRTGHGLGKTGGTGKAGPSTGFFEAVTGDPPREPDHLSLDDAPSGKGGGGARSAPSGSRAESSADRASGMADAGVKRSALEVKAGLARGGQAAVVKLASYAAGPERIGSLLEYQSRKGELALERENGALVQGKEAVTALMHQWSGSELEREPSKDSMYLRVTLPQTYVGDIRVDLGEALAGHRYAWRCERADDCTLSLHIVATAAGTLRDERGRRERYGDHQKSIGRLNEKFDRAFGVATDLEARGFAHGVPGVGRHLVRLTRAGAVAAETSDAKRPSVRDRDSVWALAKSWQSALRSKEQRDVAHIIISSKPGTDTQAFVGAARAMLAREFENREYAFALHQDKQHLHVHAVVRMRDRDGQRLHPNIGDFKRWRETMAHEARERHIEMEAVSRFDQANVPGDKLWERRAVERGTASERVRRRVEAVRGRAIHVPSREEGKRRANEAAFHWGGVAASPPAIPEPPIAAAMTRFYRPEQWSDPRRAQGNADAFTPRRAFAEQSGKRLAGVTFVDVSTREAGGLLRESRSDIFYVPEYLRGAEKLLPRSEPTILRLQERVETAAARAQTRGQSTQPQPQESPAMPSASLQKKLDFYRTRTADGAALRQGADREAYLKKHNTWMAQAEKDIEEVKAKERERARVHTGVMEETGHSPYQHDKANKPSPYIVLRCDDGKTETIWGVTMPDALAKAKVGVGDRIAVRITGRETVTTDVKVKDPETGAERVDKQSITRNVWAAEKLPDLETRSEVATTPREMENAKKRLPPAPADAHVIESAGPGEIVARPRHLDGFTFEERAKNEIHYARHDDHGQRGKTEFIDRGARLDLVNSKDDAVLLAALQVSARKWDAIQITGTEDYTNRVLSLAAEHGFNISNPELQDRLAAERERVAASRPRSVEVNSMSAGVALEAESRAASSDRAAHYRDAAAALATEVIPSAAAERRQVLYAVAGKFTGASLAGVEPGLAADEKLAVQGAIDNLSRRIHSPEPADTIESLRGQTVALVALAAVASENGLVTHPHSHARPGDTHAAYAVGRRLDAMRGPLTEAVFAGDEASFGRIAQEHSDLRALNEAIRSRSPDLDPRGKATLATLIGALEAEKDQAGSAEAPDLIRQRSQDLSALRAYERKLAAETETRAPLARKSEVELAMDSERLREHAESEARRETRQADSATRHDEHVPADGSLAHPYRSQDEAQSARDASRSLNEDPGRRIAAEPGESREVERLRQDQAKIAQDTAAEKKEQAREQTMEEELKERSAARRARMARDDNEDDDE